MSIIEINTTSGLVDVRDEPHVPLDHFPAQFSPNIERIHGLKKLRQWRDIAAKTENGATLTDAEEEQLYDGLPTMVALIGDLLGMCQRREVGSDGFVKADRQRAMLAQALGETLAATGMVRAEASLTGPELLHFASDYCRSQGRPAIDLNRFD